jgi:F-type H+-transporting ATPase subunit b
VIAIILGKRSERDRHALDKKIEAIRVQAGGSRAVRKEAEALRAEYQAKSDAADAERQTMLAVPAGSRRDCRAGEVGYGALVERRSRMAEEKIAAASVAAIDEVRAKAATQRCAAAAKLISEDLGADGRQGDGRPRRSRNSEG